jgi:prepilin-type processing-associated H-X9-DG protein
MSTNGDSNGQACTMEAMETRCLMSGDGTVVIVAEDGQDASSYHSGGVNVCLGDGSVRSTTVESPFARYIEL